MRKPSLNGSRQISARAFYGVLFAAAFGLNFVWEIAQMSAYQTKLNEGWYQALFFCALASVVDAVATIAVYALLVRLIKSNQAKFYLCAAVFGALCAVFFEWFAFRLGLWSYDEQMIVLPIIGTGLLPFIQLTILVPLAIWLAAKWKGSKMSRSMLIPKWFQSNTGGKSRASTLKRNLTTSDIRSNEVFEVD